VPFLGPNSSSIQGYLSGSFLKEQHNIHAKPRRAIVFGSFFKKNNTDPTMDKTLSFFGVKLI
jgi:hypothetical protein